MALADDISQAMGEKAGPPPQIFAGTVNSVDPLSVTLDGSGVALPCLSFSGVTLSPGRRVTVIKVGVDLVVVGGFGDVHLGTVTIDDLTLGDLDYGGSTMNTSGVSNLNVGPGTLTAMSGIGASFIAPPSGKVAVHLQGHLTVDVAFGRGVVTTQINTGLTLGSGSVYGGYTADQKYGLSLHSPTVDVDITCAAFRPVTGLVPGDPYHAQVYHAAYPANAAKSEDCYVTVIPAL